jgi:mediator of RNA polymerase II transcription subunit 12
MAETLNSATPSFSEDLDQFLSSGNTMDEVTLIAIFKTLTSQLESGGGKRRLSSNEICRYLSQLRTFNPKQFDLLLIKWIEGVLKSPTRPSLPKVLSPLVGVGCVTRPAFYAMVKKLQQAESSRRTSNMAGLRLNLAELLVPSSLSNLGTADLV